MLETHRSSYRFKVRISAQEAIVLIGIVSLIPDEVSPNPWSEACMAVREVSLGKMGQS